MIEQVKFTFSPLEKLLEKQTTTTTTTTTTKPIKNQRRKQVEALKVLKPDNQQVSVKAKIPEDELSEKTQKWN